MKQKLPAFLFILCTPLSIGIYMLLSRISSSEVLGVIGALGFFLAWVAAISSIFNKKMSTALDDTSKEMKCDK